MPTNLERAKLVIDSRRENAELSAEKRRLELETVSPELKEINQKISRAGLDALKAIGAGADSANLIQNLAKQNLALQAKRTEILASLGLPADALDVHYTCPICEDMGVKDGYYCECLKALVKQFQFENLCSCAPAKGSTFANFSLDYYKGEARERMEQIYNYCKSWAADFDRNSNSILMYGQTGLGKTHLSLAIANEVVAKGYNVIYASSGNLFNKLEKESFGRLKTDESPEEAVLTCDLLILDDLGSEFTKPYVVAELYNIINSRLLSGLPTIISTNLLYDEIGDKYNPRVYSRLIGDYQMLEFLGSDIRQLKS
ncbi:MAG: ATP-binding protein [Oscillospiraceae bacterium]|nr:ATP-binding protein [Candidatus Limimonas coprohippi]MCQ2488900.1 ATP-binding protein [Clostridia bacterium]